MCIVRNVGEGTTGSNGPMAMIYVYGPLGAGHVNPMLGITAELVLRGHTVRFWAPRPFAERIEEAGAQFEPVESTWETMSGGPPQMHGKEFFRAIGLLLNETKSMVAQCATESPPDLIVHDGTLAWWGRILAHRWNVPAVETWPNFVGNQHWSMNEYTKVSPFDPRFLWQILRAARYLRSQGITDVGAFMTGKSAAGRIVTIPRSFQYAGETFDDWSFVGPCLTDRAFQGKWVPPTSGRPVVLVSLGTAYNNRPEFFRSIMQSSADKPWHVVLAVGDRTSAESLGAIPANVEVHAQVPQLAVLQHARVFVTHAGMGSVMESLSHEVPMATVPQMAEQRANADRIAELGLGVTVELDAGEQTSSAAADAVWRAVAEVADNTEVASGLARMRSDIEHAGRASAAADVVDSVTRSG